MATETETLYADGFEGAFIGLGRIFTATVAVYDRAQCIAILMERDGMDHEGAEEFFEFNVVGAYVGPTTPVFVERMSLVEAAGEGEPE